MIHARMMAMIGRELTRDPPVVNRGDAESKWLIDWAL